MLVSFWEGFLILCGVISGLDLWLRYGQRVLRFIQKRREREPDDLFISIKVEVDSKTKKTRIIQKFGDRVEITENAGRIGDDMFCPIKMARSMANLLGLKPDGNNSWSNKL